MVLGIVALVYGFYMFMGVIALASTASFFGGSDLVALYIGPVLIFSVTAILAITFSYAAKKRGYINGISKSGLIMGIIAACFYGISFLICLASLA